MSTNEVFYTDEFFAPETDTGTVVNLSLNGRNVPVTIKSHITVEDKIAAEVAGMTRVVDATGKVTGAVTDNAKASVALLARVITEWPFKDRATQVSLPITAENVARFLGNVSEVLAQIGQQEVKSAEALAPFDQPSESPSEQPASEK